jgi:hypothetical protein
LIGMEIGENSSSFVDNYDWWPSTDGHDDLPILVRELFHNRVNDHNFTEAFVKGKFPGHVDIPRLKQGRVGGTFWSVFVACPENGTDFSDENYAASKGAWYDGCCIVYSHWNH